MTAEEALKETLEQDLKETWVQLDRKELPEKWEDEANPVWKENLVLKESTVVSVHWGQLDEMGATGQPGNTGNKGEKGMTGLQGPPGPKGNTTSTTSELMKIGS